MKFGEISIVKIFFVLSIVTFFVIFTIYVLNLAQGRQITEGGEVINTSILRINSNPIDAEVYLNDEIQVLTENRLEGITPGEITIRLSKPGYSTWEKTLHIDSQVVKDIFVQLFPSELNLEQFTTSNVDKIAYPNDTRYIYYSILNPEIKADAGLYRQRLTRNLIDFGDIQPEKIADYNSNLNDILSNNNYSLKVSNDNNQVLLNVPSNRLLFSYNTNNLNDRINITTDLGFYPKLAIWHDESISILVKNEGLIAEFFLETNEMVVIDFDIDNTTKFTKAGNKVYFIRTRENLIYEYMDRSSTLLEIPVNFNIEGELNNILAPRDNSDVFLLNVSGEFFFIDMEKEFIKKISDAISIKAISPSGNSIIYQRQGKLYSYASEESINQTSYNVTIKELDFTMDQITKLSFSNTGSNLIVLQENDEQLKTLIFRDSDGANPVTILTDSEIYGDEILLPNDSKSLYFLLNDSLNEPLDEETILQTRNIYKIDLEIN